MKKNQNDRMRQEQMIAKWPNGGGYTGRKTMCRLVVEASIPLDIHTDPIIKNK